MQLDQEIIVNGHPICHGIAIGKPLFLNRDESAIFETQIPASHTQREIERYQYALSRSKQDIKRLQKQLEMESVSEGIQILEAQLEMLQDPLLTTEIEKDIKKNKKNVEFVFQQALLKLQDRFKAINDEFFSDRFSDLQDLSRRIYGYLNETTHLSLNDVPPGSIICIHEFTASEIASAKSGSAIAFVSETGGVASHAAIIAKSRGIPFVANINLPGVNESMAELMIVDGGAGKVILNPSKETLSEYEQLRDRMQQQMKLLEQVTKWPAETYDGFSFRLSANLDMTDEIDLVHHFGGQGIGLFRTEYILLPKNEIPSEDEQFLIYKKVIDQMKGSPVVIRTFDVGGDKPLYGSTIPKEKKSFLSNRITRFLLKEQTMLKTQLRAIVRATVQGNASILFPMISTLPELLAAKGMLHQVREELALYHPIRIGCMIEVPSAVLSIDHLAKECDFFSIGTNDLIQYAMAIDRSDQVHGYYELTDPSIIRLMKLAIDEANRAEIPVSVCGEIASDPRFTALLMGLGVQELSVAPRFLPLIKNAVRNSSIVNAVQLADRVLGMKTAQEVLGAMVEDYQKMLSIALE